MNIYMGIDPGKQGGIAILRPDEPVKLFPMPLMNNQLYIHVFKTLFFGYPKDALVVAIEDVHSMFGMSAASNFAFGYICGQINALVESFEIVKRVVKVQPKVWQSEVWNDEDVIKNPMIDKTTGQQRTLKNGEPRFKIDTKATSLNAFRRIFPGVSPVLKKAPHDGIVDALLIAEWARRTNQ